MVNSEKKKINLQRPAGTLDILPEEMEKRRWLTRLIEDYFQLFGFQQIDIPLYDFFRLYQIRSGEKIIEDIFTFYDPPKHRAKENPELYALRPEFTAPFVRFYITSELMYRPKPQKVFYIGPCFRYDEPSPGRYRQFTQAGVELFGSNTPMADAEVISLAMGLMKKLQIEDYLLRLNDLTILRTFLEENGIPFEKQNKVFGIIDKIASLLRKLEIGALEKVTQEELIDDYYAMMQEEGISRDLTEQLEPLLLLVGTPKEIKPQLEKLFENYPKTQEAIKQSTLFTVCELLLQAGVEPFVIDNGIARGLDYYTNIVFEIDVPILGKEKQVCGGGRYNRLVEEFGGENTPATGFAFGFDRLLIALEKQGRKIGCPFRADVFIGMKPEAYGEGMRLASQLREKGIRVELDLMNRSFKNAAKFVNAMKIPIMIFLGPRELESKKYTVKNFYTKEQKKDLSLSELYDVIFSWKNEISQSKE